MAYETRCKRIQLKPGSMDRVREWADEINGRRDEALATLRDEGVVVESVFLEQRPDGDFLIYYMKAEDFERGRRAFEGSTHPLDAYHQAFKRDTWASGTTLELLVDLDRIDEG